MTDSETSLPPPPMPPVPQYLRRAVHDKKVAGVAAGMARHFGVDVTLVRLGFVALALFGGSGLVLYAVAWIVMPADAVPEPTIPPPDGPGPIVPVQPTV